MKILYLILLVLFNAACSSQDSTLASDEQGIGPNAGATPGATPGAIPGAIPDVDLDANARPPNIVFIYIDDLGWTDLWDSDFYQTPNIDAFRKQSLSFTRAYTSPLCAPSRAALMSGKYGVTTGVYKVGGERKSLQTYKPNNQFAYSMLEPQSKTSLSTDFYTIAESLKTKNYQTIHLGKWHLSAENGPANESPEQQGFDVNYGGNHHHSPPNKDESHGFFANDQGKFPSLPNLGTVAPKAYVTDHLTQLAIDWMGNIRSPENPFFMYFSHFAVHTPIQVTTEYQDRIRQEAQAKGINLHEQKCAPGAGGCWGRGTPQCGTGQKHCNLNYAAMLRNLDDNFGRILKYLEQTPENSAKPNGAKLIDNTIVIFYADNGGFVTQSSQKPLRGAKGNIYEGGVLVPLMVRWDNRIQANTESDIPVINVDFFPTFNALAGVQYDAQATLYNSDVNTYRDLDGVDISPILFNNSSKDTLRNRYLFWHYPMSPSRLWDNHPTSAIIQDNMKLIYNYGLREFELYDLQADRNETTNLINTPNLEPTANRLAGELRDWVGTRLLPRVKYSEKGRVLPQRVPEKVK